jgi:hypothetical protein
VADRAGSGSSQLLEFDVSCVELSGFASSVLDIIYGGFQPIFS